MLRGIKKDQKKIDNNELNLVLFLSLSIKRKNYGNCFQEQAC